MSKVLIVDDNKDNRELMKYSLEAVEARLKVEKVNAMRSEFLVDMGHELKTLMHGILSFSGFGIKKISKIRNFEGKEDLLEYFQEIKGSGEQLFKLLNELFNLSKPEAGRSLHSFKKKKLSVIIEGVVEEMKHLYKGKSPNIVFNKPDFDDVVEMDLEKMTQTIKNLLLNVLQFSLEGQEIVLNIYGEEKRVLFSIEGKELGVFEENVFGSFVQSSKSKNGAGGAGLGLSIAKNIIQSHGGRIWVESNPGGGAIFRFTIPRKQN